MIKPMTFTLIALSLSACGGGGGDTGGGTSTPTSGFATATATGTANISAVSLDSVGRATSASTGTLDGDSNALTLGGLSGALNDSRTEGSLNSGGRITLDPAATKFASTFDATPRGANRTIGVIGVTATDVPTTGAVTYTGTSSLTIQDGADVYDLAGNSSVVANFGDGAVVSTISDLSGTKRSGVTAAPTNVSDVATITFRGSAINGTTFAGGTAELTSDMVTALSGSEQTGVNGVFFGQTAAETGAAFVIDDAANGSTTVLGTLVAK